MPDCIFCRIAQKKEAASTVYEDDQCIAFMDLFPLTKGHILVVPKQHAILLNELDSELHSHLFSIGSRLVEAQRKAGFGQNGTNFLVNDGKAANQTVPHIHLHLIPRQKGDFLKAIPKLALHITGLFGLASNRKKLDIQASQVRQQLGN